jgi:hypothetical protein
MKIISLLSALDKATFKRIDAYMASDYWYKRPESQRLYAFLRKPKTDYTVLQTDKERVFKAVFGAEVFSNLMLARTINFLTNDLENAYQQHLFEENKSIINPIQAKKHYENDNTIALNSLVENWQTDFENIDKKNIAFYKAKHLLEEAKVLATPVNKINANTNDALNETFTLYSIAEKLRIYTAVLSNSYHVKADIKDDYANILIANLAEMPYNQEPVIAIYYNLILIIKGDDTVFQTLLTLLEQNIAIFEHSEAEHIYRLLENACAINLNQGKRQFLKHIFELYQQEIENEIIFDTKGFIRTSVFLNIVKVAILNKEYAWAKQFLYDYKTKLPETEREDVFQYNLASIYFEAKNYDAALDILNKIEYIDITYKIAARILRLKIYYILQEQAEHYYTILESELNAYTIFVYRLKDLNTQQKNRYKNFAYYLAKILQLLPKDKTAAQKLVAKLERSDTAEKSWLLRIIVL